MSEPKAKQATRKRARITDKHLKVVELVDAGKTVQEIQKELKIQTKNQVDALYLRGLVDKGKARPLIDLGRRGSSSRKVGKNGTVLLGRPLMVDYFGFSPGDQISFTVSDKGKRVVMEKK
ncbi:MAG: hypothetical protein HYY96_08275 [Candidatus Tectomicrobia bacterium]|nr:hypothetical protein [Candidatus Tectomicrobia bacterium]